MNVKVKIKPKEDNSVTNLHTLLLYPQYMNYGISCVYIFLIFSLYSACFKFLIQTYSLVTLIMIYIHVRVVQLLVKYLVLNRFFYLLCVANMLMFSMHGDSSADLCTEIQMAFHHDLCPILLASKGVEKLWLIIHSQMFSTSLSLQLSGS